MKMKFTTYGSVRGQGKVFSSRQAAENSLEADRRACCKQGGYSDRQLCAVDVEGFLRQIDEDGNLGDYVWPSHRKSCGAVRAE